MLNTEHGIGSIAVMVEGEGLAEVELVHIPHGSTVAEIIAVVAAKGGYMAEEAVLYVEDCDQSLDHGLVVTEEVFGRRIHHVHRARNIEVKVFYQARHIDRRFAPSARVQRALDWAVSPEGFKIDPSIAPEMELALHGHTTPLPKNAHLGRYFRHPCHELELDLIRGVVPNGSSR